MTAPTPRRLQFEGSGLRCRNCVHARACAVYAHWHKCAGLLAGFSPSHRPITITSHEHAASVSCPSGRHHAGQLRLRYERARRDQHLGARHVIRRLLGQHLVRHAQPVLVYRSKQGLYRALLVLQYIRDQRGCGLHPAMGAVNAVTDQATPVGPCMRACKSTPTWTDQGNVRTHAHGAVHACMHAFIRSLTWMARRQAAGASRPTAACASPISASASCTGARMRAGGRAHDEWQAACAARHAVAPPPCMQARSHRSIS